MFVGVMALRYQHHTTLLCRVDNSHKHSQSPLINAHYSIVGE